MAKELLGHGGFGQVWLLDTDPPMVMKEVIGTDDYEVYLRELRALKELSHENVVRYYDQPDNYSENDSCERLIFMEYCEHGSLKDVLKNPNIVYSMATIAQWSTEMFSALEYIKSKELVHHDVKPDNIFVYGHDYTLKLGDFGCVRNMKTTAYGGGGTRGYMAPEVIRGRKMDGEDVYKCDIYSAGWVVLDMVNRSVGNSCIGNNGIDEILKDRPHLATLNTLIVGCTKQNAKERLRAEKAMVLCGKLTKEFMEFDAKPDTDRPHKRLEPPIGLFLMGSDASQHSYDITPPPGTYSTCGTDGSSATKQSKGNSNPSERLLIELKEQLETPTAFDERVLRDEERICKDGRGAKGCKGNDHANCKKNRRELCDKILTMLSELPTEDQYSCAEAMNEFWKVKAPSPFYDKYSALPKIRDEKLTGPIANILDAYMMLVKRDRWHQSEAHSFGVWVLSETHREILPRWDILKAINKAVYDIEDLGKLFTVRARYNIGRLKGSRHSWFRINEAGAYLREDCSEICVYIPSAEFRDISGFAHCKPLNNEQIRRALIEAGKHLETFLRSLDDDRLFTRIGDLPPDIKVRSDLTPKIDAFPGQPFPGYYFLNGNPPNHECHKGRCGITEGAGFPKTVAPEFRVKVPQCATTDQIDFIEEYTLITRALHYICQWQVRAPIWRRDLVEALLTEIEVKPRQSKFLFALLEIEDCSNALLFQYSEWLLSFMVITKNLELLDYSYKKVKCLRLIGLTLADLTPMLGAIRDYYNQYGVFSQDGDRRAVDPEVMQPLINAFWNEIMTTKSEEWEALTRDIVCESDSDDPEFESESE